MFIKITHTTVDKLAALTKEKKLSRGLDIIVLLIIAKHSWGDGEKPNPCVLMASEIAESLGCSTSSVKRALRFLRDAGVIQFLYRTKAKREQPLATTDEDKAYKRAMRGARTLRNYYRITDRGIGTMVNTKKMT